MSKTPSSIVYKNALPLRGSEKLYLDERTADVFFVFSVDSEKNVTIPAHKGILSAISPVFDEMFFGATKCDENIINIDDTTPDAFKEFLQFFYLNRATLTVEQKMDVISLCKQYKLNDSKEAYNDFFKASLNMDNMCHGYELAILFEQNDLKEYCEQQISKNARQIFQSSSFLCCKPSLLHRILQMDSLNCRETVVFDACMAWAKANCLAKSLDEKYVQNVRAQLGDLLFDIRFGEMSIGCFYMCYQSYEELFTAEEFKEIIGLIASKDFQSIKFNRNPRKRNTLAKSHDGILVCDRVDPVRSSYSQCYTINAWDYTVFTSNCGLLLTKIVCSEVFNDKNQTIPSRMKVVELIDGSEDVLYLCQLALSCTAERTIELPMPIEIKPNAKYAIIFEIREATCYNLLAHKPIVDIGDGVLIEFHDYNFSNDYAVACTTFGLITRLYFVNNE